MAAKPIRALGRGLEVLAALNRLGEATAGALAAASGVPRPTVYRVLETLRQGGYVAAIDERWSLRLGVRALSDGFEDEEWITTIAAPALHDLTARIRWPCDLATLEGTSMVIRVTTHKVAPFSIDRAMLGRALPVLESAMGLAWLAFAPAAERQALLAMLGARPMARRLAEIRRQGHALRLGGRWPHTASVAVPVMAGGRLLGCAAAIWMARAVPPEEGLRQCLAPLRDAVGRIAAGLEGHAARKPP